MTSVCKQEALYKWQPVPLQPNDYRNIVIETCEGIQNRLLRVNRFLACDVCALEIIGATKDEAKSM